MHECLLIYVCLYVCMFICTVIMGIKIYLCMTALMSRSVTSFKFVPGYPYNLLSHRAPGFFFNTIMIVICCKRINKKIIEITELSLKGQRNTNAFVAMFVVTVVVTFIKPRPPSLSSLQHQFKLD